MCADLIEAARTNNRSIFESLDEKHDNITKFINHSLRLLNKRHEVTKNTAFKYNIICMLDKIVDIMKNSGRELLVYNKKIKKESYDVMKMIYESFDLAQSVFLKYNPEKVKLLSELKENIHNTILEKVKHIPKEESLLLHNMHHVLELHRSLSESRMALEF